MYVYYYRTYEKSCGREGEREKGEHVLKDTTSRGLCVRVRPPHTIERRACCHDCPAARDVFTPPSQPRSFAVTWPSRPRTTSAFRARTLWSTLTVFAYFRHHNGEIFFFAQQHSLRERVCCLLVLFFSNPRHLHNYALAGWKLHCALNCICICICCICTCRISPALGPQREPAGMPMRAHTSGEIKSTGMPTSILA